jgi:anti-sigma B factor antagonist
VRLLAAEHVSADGVDVLAVSGDIDIASSARLIPALNDVVTNGAFPVVVDLSDVDFMDSTGLALLLNALRRVTRRGHGFAVVCPEGPVRRVFEVTDMVHTLKVHATRAAALEAATAAV